MKLSTIPITLVILLFGFFTCQQILAEKVETGQSSGAELSVLSSSGTGMTLVHKVSEFNLDVVGFPEGDYCRITIPGNAKSNLVGNPELPVYRRLIEIPQGAEPVVRILNFSEKEYKLGDYDIAVPVVPLQPPQPKCGDSPDFICSAEAYQQNDFSDDVMITADVLGTMRGVRIARLNIHSVKYNPVKQVIRVIENIEFEVNFKGADPGQTDYLKRKLYSPYFAGLYETLFNHSDVSIRENFTLYPVKYVIISDRMFEPQLQPFIEWKKQKGFIVVESYTDEIGNSKQEIKDHIEDLYDEGTEEDPAPSFVLFVGDIAQVPTWDNGDGVTDRNYCEFTGDLFPEIFYGRFSAENTDQLQPCIDKTLQYEQFTMPDPSYLAEVVMVAGMDGSHGYDWANGQINYGTINYFNEAHDIYSQTYLYPESGSQSAAIRQDISDGITFGNYTAHCSPDGWADPSFKISHISSLTNQDKYGLLIGNCCSSSEYQTTCFAEEIVRAENKGAVGYIGGSNSTYWDEDYYFGIGVGEISEDPPDYEETTLGNYDRSFHDHGEPFSDWFVTQDQIIFAGNLAVTESGSSLEAYYWDIYNLIGDPSLMVYYGIPDEMDAEHNPFLLVGSETFEVNTVPYAYVSLNLDDVNLGVALADENGYVELTFDPIATPGNAELVITAQNRQPYIEELLVIAPEGPYLVYTGHTQNDDSVGNGNNKAEFDEQIYLGITLENFGTEDANNVIVNLSTTNPYVTIVDEEEDYATIKSGETGWREKGFLIELADNIPDQMTMNFEVLARDEHDSIWMSEFSATAYAPVLAPLELTVEDEDGNNRLDPGETAVIKIRTANKGHCPVENVTASLVAYNPFITVVDNDTVIPFLGLLGASFPEFEVVVEEDAPEGFLADLHFTLSAAGYEEMKIYKPKIGLLLEDWETGGFNKYDWEFDGEAAWEINAIYPFEGLFDARSGAIDDDEASVFSIQYEVMALDSISFYKKVSSEKDSDKLSFYIDGQKKEDWSGSTEGWTREAFAVSPGTHEFTWEYRKNNSGAAGADKAWIDYIELPTMMVTTVFAGPDEETCLNNGYFQCYGAATNYDSLYWASSGSGTFNNKNIMMPLYTPSEEDLSDEILLLSLNLIDADGEYASDTMQLFVSSAPPAPSTPEGPDKVELDITTESEYTVGEVEGANGYLWSVFPDSAGQITGTGTTALVNWNLSFEGNAWVKSAAENECGTGEYSDSLWIIVSDPVGINPVNPKIDFSIMPNPNNGIFKIAFHASENTESNLLVMNNIGQIVTMRQFMSGTGNQEISINLSHLERGFYFVMLETGNQRKVKKLLFNK
jgi:hypothetical protein